MLMLCQEEKLKKVKAFAAEGERLSKFASVLAAARLLYIVALRFVRDYLRRRFAHFKLRAHFLDLRCLLF